MIHDPVHETIAMNELGVVFWRDYNNEWHAIGGDKKPEDFTRPVW